MIDPLPAVLRSLFPSSGPAVAVHLHEYGFDAVGHVDPEEHQRRRDVGLGAIPDCNLIGAICALPEHEAVRRIDLTGRETRSPIIQAYVFANVADVDAGLDRFAVVPPVLPRVAVVRASPPRRSAPSTPAAPPPLNRLARGSAVLQS